jgi:hypothetical protein
VTDIEKTDESGVAPLQAAEAATDWEPLYGFCSVNEHSNESLARALEAIRRRICAYGGNGRCDCKYGRDATKQQRAGSEQTGCPELVEVIHRLLHRPETFAANAAPSEASPKEAP